MKKNKRNICKFNESTIYGQYENEVTVTGDYNIDYNIVDDIDPRPLSLFTTNRCVGSYTCRTYGPYWNTGHNRDGRDKISRPNPSFFCLLLKLEI